MLTQDAADDRKPKAGAHADRLRGEERLENAVLEIGRNTRPVVLDVEKDAVRLVSRPQHDAAGTAGFDDGLLTVHDEVENDLLELHGIGESGRELGIEIEFDGDAGMLKIGGAKAEGALDDLVQVDDGALEFRFAREHQQAAHDARGAFGFLADAMCLGERLGIELALEQ